MTSRINRQILRSILSLLLWVVVITGCWSDRCLERHQRSPALALDYNKDSLFNSDFSGRDFTDSSFTKANLRNSNLSNTNLRRVGFFAANLESAIWRPTSPMLTLDSARLIQI